MHESQRLIVAVALLGSLPVAGAAQASPPACPDSGRRALGIEWLHCIGGPCTYSQSADGQWLRFATEPTVWGIVSGGPADGVLRDGDVLVRVDDHLITTPEAGQVLANPPGNRSLVLGIRRGGRRMSVRIQSVGGCRMPALAVTPTAGDPRGRRLDGYRGAPAPPTGAPAPAAPGFYGAAGDVSPPGRLGLGVRCGGCGYALGADGTRRWRSAAPMIVEFIEKGGPADTAGLQPGDVISEVNGFALSDERAERLLGELRPGQALVLSIRRRDTALQVRIVGVRRRAVSGSL